MRSKEVLMMDKENRIKMQMKNSNNYSGQGIIFVKIGGVICYQPHLHHTL